MDDLRAFADAGQAERRREVAAVRRMVDEEVDRFTAVSTAQEVAPLVAALHERGESIRSAELERFRARLAGLDDRQVEAVEALTRGIVAKLLHEPTVEAQGRGRHASGRAPGRRAARPVRRSSDRPPGAERPPSGRGAGS